MSTATAPARQRYQWEKWGDGYRIVLYAGDLTRAKREHREAWCLVFRVMDSPRWQGRVFWRGPDADGLAQSSPDVYSREFARLRDAKIWAEELVLGVDSEEAVDAIFEAVSRFKVAGNELVERHRAEDVALKKEQRAEFETMINKLRKAAGGRDGA